MYLDTWEINDRDDVVISETLLNKTLENSGFIFYHFEYKFECESRNDDFLNGGLFGPVFDFWINPNGLPMFNSDENFSWLRHFNQFQRVLVLDSHVGKRVVGDIVIVELNQFLCQVFLFPFDSRDRHNGSVEWEFQVGTKGERCREEDGNVALVELLGVRLIHQERIISFLKNNVKVGIIFIIYTA